MLVTPSALTVPLLAAFLCLPLLPLPRPAHLKVDEKAVRRLPQTVQHWEATELGSTAWEHHSVDK